MRNHGLPRSTFIVITGISFTLATLYLYHQNSKTNPDLLLKAASTTTTTAVIAADARERSGSSRASGSAALPRAHPPTNRRPSLTVVCFSDTHGLYAEAGLIHVPAGDMLLFAGDAAVGSAAEGLRFSSWLQGLPVSGPRVVTWGNMDTATPGLSDPVPGALVLVNTIQEVNGYRIFTSPWTPRFAGAYQLDHADEVAATAYWSALLPPNADVDIILTHGPPYGIADSTSGEHRGDKGLLKAVQALQRPPLLWLCGHIHEQYGIHTVPHPQSPPGGGIPLLNAAVFYTQYPAHAARAQPRVVKLPQVEVQPLEVGAAS